MFCVYTRIIVCENIVLKYLREVVFHIDANSCCSRSFAYNNCLLVRVELLAIRVTYFKQLLSLCVLSIVGCCIIPIETL